MAVRKFLIGIFLAASLLPTALHAQGLWNHGARLVIVDSAAVYISGKGGNFANDSIPGYQGIVILPDTGSLILEGNWTNNAANGVFTSNNGAVILAGDTQVIGGKSGTSFYHLILSGTGLKKLDHDIFVGGAFGNPNGRLLLGDRPLALNSKQLFLTNPNPSGINRLSGYIISDSMPVSGYGRLRWQIGKGRNGSTYILPFGTRKGVYVPLTFNIAQAGVAPNDSGYLQAATYPTKPSANPNNRPLPLGVSNLDNEYGIDNSENAVDRFWVLDAEGYQTLPKATLHFTYADEEWDKSNGSTNDITKPEIQASRYDSVKKKWILPPFGQGNTASNEVVVTGTAGYNGAWTLVNKTVCPVADMLFANGCVMDSAQLTDKSSVSKGKITRWLWNFADGTTSSLQNPRHAWAQPGTYMVKLKVTANSGCSDSIMKTITIYALPESRFAYQQSTCLYDTIHFADASIPGGASLVSWDFGDGSKSSLAKPKHKYNVPGDYKVILKVTNANGCSDTSTQVVTVHPAPAASFTGPATSCQMDAVSFADGSSGTIQSWLWDFGDGTKSSDQNPVHPFKKAGTFTVREIVTTSFGCSDTAFAQIIVHPKPLALFSATPNPTTIITPKISFTNLSSGYDKWEWDFGDLNGSTDKNPVHEYEDTGAYRVTLRVYNQFGCGDTFPMQVVVAPDYRIWIPNAFTPTDDRINEEFKPAGVLMNITKYDMQVYDRWGTLLFESHDINRGWDGNFRTGDPAPLGVYVYYITLRDHLAHIHSYKGNVTLIR